MIEAEILLEASMSSSKRTKSQRLKPSLSPKLGKRAKRPLKKLKNLALEVGPFIYYFAKLINITKPVTERMY